MGSETGLNGLPLDRDSGLQTFGTRYRAVASELPRICRQGENSSGRSINQAATFIDYATAGCATATGRAAGGALKRSGAADPHRLAHPGHPGRHRLWLFIDIITCCGNFPVSDIYCGMDVVGGMRLGGIDKQAGRWWRTARL